MVWIFYNTVPDVLMMSRQIRLSRFNVSNERAELKAYDKIGLVYFNMGDIDSARFFHERGMASSQLGSTREDGRRLIRELLLDLFEKGTAENHEVLLEEFLRGEEYESEWQMWRKEKILSLNPAQDQKLMEFLFGFRLAIAAQKTRIECSPSSSFLGGLKSRPLALAKSPFDPLSESEKKSETNRSGLEGSEERDERLMCECRSKMFFEEMCVYCEAKKEEEGQMKRRRQREVKKRGLSGGAGTLGSSAGARRLNTNKFGESRFICKNNTMQKKKVCEMTILNIELYEL